jgi:hypothetical protein
MCMFDKKSFIDTVHLQCVIEKENNFKQAGERYRTFDPARSLPQLIDLSLFVHAFSYLSCLPN